MSPIEEQNGMQAYVLNAFRRWQEQQQPQQGVTPGVQVSQQLPDAVMRSITQQPSYAEGQLIPPRRPIPAEILPENSTQDRERLFQELMFKRNFPGMDFPLAEGQSVSPTPQSPYAAPRSQMLGRLPGTGLY